MKRKAGQLWYYQRAKIFSCLVRCSIILFFLFNSLSSQSQIIRKFTTTPEEFIVDLEQFLVASHKEKGEKLATKFHKLWKDDEVFSLDQQRMIMGTANSMLKKRLKAFPDFENYINALRSLVASELPITVFDDWHNAIENSIKGSTRDFKFFLETSVNLFSTNTIYSSTSTEWRSSNSNFIFKFDKVPFIEFPDLDLICYSKGDSSKIINTHGKYYPLKKTWVGKGGKVTWEKAGLDPEVVYALIRNYEIAINKSLYAVDSVIFYNKSMFTVSHLGKLEEACRANRTVENATYPRFSSYDKTIEVPKIAQNVSYIGGFSMEGTKIIGSGSKNQLAKMSFYKDGKVAVFVKGKRFLFAKGKISADDAATSIYIENDSIYHPGLNLKYLVDEREFAFIRKTKGDFYDSYHDLNMNFEAIYWKFDQPTMEMKTLSGAGEIPALIVSSEFFNKADFMKWGSMMDYNPLGKLASYAKKYELDEFYAEELAKYMKLSPDAIRGLLMDFANEGYIYYDYSDEIIYIRPKLKHYIKSNAGRKDYDAIYFTSLVDGTNATLDLQTGNLEIRGVPHFFLSDSQNVVALPNRQTITIKKNRNVIFSGVVVTKRFDFYGRDFDFNYDDFTIYMEKLDSVKIKIPTGKLDEDGRPIQVYMQSTLEKLSGNLQIDHPKNKSGRMRKHFRNYPIFNSETDSYVFYGKQKIQKGLYARNKFYFHVEPFTIDSLETFDVNSMAFGGTFVSAGIFPNFKEKLKAREDNSLGFISQTPEEGYEIYKGKGQYFAGIDLSNKGLRGSGKLDYLTSSSQSSSFLFLPDSANFKANLFDMKKDQFGVASFPHVGAYETQNHWVPQRDSMYIKMKKGIPIHMFEDEVLFNGDMVLTPRELSGNGIARLIDSELESDYMVFKMESYLADTADFRLISIDKDKLAFDARGVIANLDLKERIGKFKSNDQNSSTVIFPYNQYIGSFKGFTWEMDQKTLGFETPPSADIEDSYLTSIHPKQDSLRFSAPKATYNLVDYIIYCEQVSEILVADAIIIPESGKVVVQKKAKMQTLLNSRIIANTSTKYHTIYDATVNILGRKRYRGSGNYDYVTKDNQMKTFYFKEVDVDTSLHTYATGDIRESMNFILNPKFLYKGKVILTSSEEFLEFKGYV
ncbi:MAG: hypothetical protein JKY33_08080 [Bacteroidia bacterium]|nr:hypothetical protein [Bacteroidia bacterium]